MPQLENAKNPNTWHDNFITLEPPNTFICWDETQSIQIGKVDDYHAAVKLLDKYAKTLNYNEDCK